ncbi:hypothetical protein HNR65_003444 [Desulfosalsimonas propionicica]|uniref:Uncharacterized protein n=1 Tax=Desulfosalsimonas propionicica TaxID=332175 RepID=A0A7W0CC80_9BACT|nr:hypothetical protein [Desulfosalsimonas propionicica]MBA2883087.1 hypothetical protein [Desulfosalsimonas propionicica]
MKNGNIIEARTQHLLDALRAYNIDPAQYLEGVVHRLDAEQAEQRLKRKRKRQRQYADG